MFQDIMPYSLENEKRNIYFYDDDDSTVIGQSKELLKLEYPVSINIVDIRLQLNTVMVFLGHTHKVFLS